MKSFLRPKFLLFFLLVSNLLTAQSYINAVCKLNNGESLSGLLKNNFETDDEFIFFKQNDQEKKIVLSDIATIVIDGKEEYISQLIYFHPNRLLNPQQIFDSETTDLTVRTSRQVLLKILVKGDVTLYQTSIDGKFLYYYTKGNVTTLEYLEFYNYKSSEGTIRSHEFFKRALFKDVNCNNQTVASYQYIDYDEKDLVATVNKHNICVNGASTVLTNVSDSQNKFRLYAFGGIKMVNGNIESGSTISKDKFTDNHSSPNFGIEFSYLAGRNKKSEIFTRLDYSTIEFMQSAISNANLGVFTYEENIQFESSVIGFMLGYRYNFNSLEDNKKGNFGLDFGINTAIPVNESFFYRNRIVGTNNFGELDLSNSVSSVVFGVSVGTSYTYLKRYTVEVRYTMSSNYVDTSVLPAKFSNLNIGFKYLILD